MPPSEKFRLFVIGCLAFLVSFVLIWAFVLDGPIPILRVKEMQPSDKIPTFQEHAEQTKTVDEMWEGGSVPEDPATAKLRHHVSSSLGTYRNSPCDKDLKEAYVEAVVDFIEDRMDRMSDNRHPSDSSEVIEISGKIYDLSLKYDEPVMSEIISSVGEGLLTKKDIPGKMAILVAAGEQEAGGAENIYAACNSEKSEAPPEEEPEEQPESD